VLRRDTATALKALDDYLAGFGAAAPGEEPAPPPVAQARFREAVAILKTTATPLRLLPATLRSRLRYLPAAVLALDQCAAALPAVTVALTSRPMGNPREPVDAIRATIGELRLVNARQLAADPVAWQRLAGAIRGLPATIGAPAQAPAPASPEPALVRAEPATLAVAEPAAAGRSLASSKRVLAYVNRAHATTFEILSEISREGSSLTYLVQDAGGREAQLTWNRDSTVKQVAGTTLVEVASGRTPSGYPYRLAAPAEPAGPSGGGHQGDVRPSS
jgi:hypothetical protein